jgi:hypothetical protein
MRGILGLEQGWMGQNGSYEKTITRIAPPFLNGHINFRQGNT